MTKEDLINWLKDYDDDAEILVSVDMVADPDPEKFRRVHGSVNEVVPIISEKRSDAILLVEGKFNKDCVFAELKKCQASRDIFKDTLDILAGRK